MGSSRLSSMSSAAMSSGQNLQCQHWIPSYNMGLVSNMLLVPLLHFSVFPTMPVLVLIHWYYNRVGLSMAPLHWESACLLKLWELTLREEASCSDPYEVLQNVSTICSIFSNRVFLLFLKCTKPKNALFGALLDSPKNSKGG